MALTQETAQRRVELVRCSACDTRTWRLDGSEVDKIAALGALSAAFARTAPAAASRPARTPAPRRGRVVTRTPAPKAAPTAPDLAALLVGWQVLGA